MTTVATSDAAKIAKSDKKEMIINSDIVRRLCAPDATQEELQMFIYMCKKYGLNPLQKEIYFMRARGKAITIISRQGYLTIANRSPEFDGMESDVIFEGDSYAHRDDGSFYIIPGPNHFNQGPDGLRAAYCNIYRKDRSRPTCAMVFYKSACKPTEPWRTNPEGMIIKCAENKALEKAFALSLEISEEE